LIRALGGGGAVASLVTSGWKTPVVKAVVLPGHAAGSAGNSVAPNCTVYITHSASYNQGYTMYVAFNTTIVDSAPFNNSSGSLSGSTTINAALSPMFPRGMITADGSAGNLSHSITVSCCNASESVSNTQNITTNGVGFELNLFVSYDDGICSVVDL